MLYQGPKNSIQSAQTKKQQGTLYQGAKIKTLDKLFEFGLNV